MGSLRNPIGPLPSSIYWRRRAVALAILALLVLLTVWAVGLAGDGGDGGDERGNNAGGPTDAITPGPSSSDPAITERPGGRDEVDGGGTGGDGGGDTGGGTGGDTGGGTEGAAGGGDGGRGGALAGSSGSLTGGDGLPAGSGTPACKPGDVTVELTSAENEYEPGDTPELKLTVRNEGGGDCRVDLGREATVVTITDSGDRRVWSSDDCPPHRDPAYVKVPAGDSTTHSLEWDRERSKPECGTPSPKRAGAGTYLVEVEVGGLSTAQTSFVLAKD